MSKLQIEWEKNQVNNAFHNSLKKHRIPCSNSKQANFKKLYNKTLRHLRKKLKKIERSPMPCSRIIRINIAKMVSLPMAIYRFN